MLAEKRFELIIQLVNEKKSVTTQELMEYLKTSESTIRRDLTTLNASGKLVKVHGGALAVNSKYTTSEDTVDIRKNLNQNDKMLIAKYASGLIGSDDFVYIDAGTSTEMMIEFLSENTTAVFVTNAISHAQNLSKKGFRTYLIGGELKAATEAIVGNEAILNINKYNFTKGFFGTNGVNFANGFTTPDTNEAMIKQAAIKKCKNVFILCDNSKFNQICPITFAKFDDAQIITTKLRNTEYKGCKNITEVNDL